ncbi:MAG: alanine racemase [Bacteroidales bacterium]
MFNNRIKRPALVLDEYKCRSNIRYMAGKAKASGISFRPHFKTHQSASIGTWFRDEGITQITVSSVTMADFFSRNGWNDITIAFPLNLRELNDARIVSERSKLNILTSGLEHLKLLDRKIRFRADCFIKIDTGYKRTGVDWNDYDQLMRMTTIINRNKLLRMKGFLLHTGHTYSASSVESIREIYNDALCKTKELRSRMQLTDIICSTGDTPSCSVVENLSGFDEIRPGNFVFYDLMQYQLGSCSREQIAVAVYCPVIDINVSRNEVLIYGGAVHLSKESIVISNGIRVFGEVVFPGKEGWFFPGKRIFLKSVTQEHGIVSVPDSMMKHFKRGELIGIIPVHSCLTVDVLREYHTFDGRIINDLSPK